MLYSKNYLLFLLTAPLLAGPTAFATPVSFEAQCGATDPIVSGSLDSLPAAADFGVVPKAGLLIESFGGDNNMSEECQTDGDCWDYQNIYDPKGCGLVTVSKAYSVTITGSTYSTGKSWEPQGSLDDFGDVGGYAVCPALKVIGEDTHDSLSEAVAFTTTARFGKSGMASFDGSFSAVMKNDFGTEISVQYGYASGRLVPLSFSTGSGKKRQTCRIKLN